MNREELLELFEFNKLAFVLAYLDELGCTPVEVERYKPRRSQATPTEVEGFQLTIADRTGGGEGEGEYMDIVFKIADTEGNAMHFRMTGSYNSWEASEWYPDVEIVEPREVTVTQWFAV